MTEEQRRFVREKIFPYWKGKSLEEAFLARPAGGDPPHRRGHRCD